MKLQEILFEAEEDDSTMALSEEQIAWWFDHVRIRIGNGKNLPNPKRVLEKSFQIGKPIKLNYQYFGIDFVVKNGSSTLSACPISADEFRFYFPQLKDPIAINVNGGVFTDESVLPKLHYEDIYFHPYTVKSLKQLVAIKPEYVYFSNSTTFDCGLLSLLKLGEFEMQFGPGGSRGTDAHMKGIEAFKIVKKYIGKENNMLECQDELIEKGFDEYAKL